MQRPASVREEITVGGKVNVAVISSSSVEDHMEFSEMFVLVHRIVNHVNMGQSHILSSHIDNGIWLKKKKDASASASTSNTVVSAAVQ